MTVAELLHAGLSAQRRSRRPAGRRGRPPTGRSATCSPARSSAGSSRCRPRRTFAGTLRPYQERGLAWLDVPAVGSGSAASSPTTWAWARRSSCWPCCCATPAPDAADAAGLPDVAGRQLAARGGPVRARRCGCTSTTAPSGPRGRQFAAAVAGADLVITTYALAARDAAALAEIDWHRVVLDEAQAIKNAATRQAVAVRALPARHRIAVTGTPVENRLADLWSHHGVRQPRSARQRRRPSSSASPSRSSGAATRRRPSGCAGSPARSSCAGVKTDKSIIADLPEKLEMEVLCNLTAEQAALYQAVVDDMLDADRAAARASSGAGWCWPR